MKNLYVVATPIGNLKDISLRAKEVLDSVDAVLAEDTRVTSKLLFNLNIKKTLISCHKFNELKVGDSLEELFKKYSNLVLVSDAGTPAVSDPGAIIVQKARELGINIVALPGPSAVITALSLAGINKTEFAFLGFFPRSKGEQIKLIKTISKSIITTFVFYESPLRLIETLEVIKRELFNLNSIYVFNDLTKEYEKHYVGSIDCVLQMLKNNQNATLGEYVVVLNLNKIKEQAEEISLEARLVDYCVKNNSPLKTAIKELSIKGYNKNNLYKASLNLKNKF